MDQDQRKAIRVLFVDDNRINRKVVVNLLKHMDLQVTEAEDGYQAMDILSNNSFDLILMDILMPGLNGYETAQLIRKRQLIDESTPILAVTANDSDIAMDDALASGMNGVLTKPLHKEDVQQQLVRFFDDVESEPLIPSSDSALFDVKSFEMMYQEPFLQQEIIDSFLSQTQKNQYELQQAFRTEDCTIIKQKVSYVRGLFKYLYAPRIMEIIDSLMALCEQEKLVEVSKAESIIIHEYDAVVDALKEYRKNK